MTYFGRTARKIVVAGSAVLVLLAALFGVGLAFGVPQALAGGSTTYYACLKGGRLSSVGAIPPNCKAPATQITLGANGANVITTPATPYGSCNSGDTDIALSTDEVWSCLAGNWTDTGSNTKGATGVQGPTGAQGPAGSTGPQGPAGASTAGPAGLDVTTQTFAWTGTSAQISCGSSTPYAIGGGVDPTSGTASVTSSYPMISSGTPIGWQGSVSSPGLTVYVVCSK
jgi:hypothetical protein